MRTMRDIKADLVAAHRAGNWDAAKKLSQEKQRLRRVGHCEVCGVAVTPRRGSALVTRFCQMHGNVNRFYRNILTATTLVILVAGCAHNPIPVVDQHEPRPMLRNAEQAIMEAPAAPSGWVMLAWENELHLIEQERWSTVIQGSTDLTNWYELARMRYDVGTMTVTLSNRPQSEFYRALDTKQ